VLSHPETLAHLGCFEEPVEDWSVSNPFVAGIARGPIGVEQMQLPWDVAEWLREAGRMPVALDAAIVCSRRVASRPDLNAIRRACRLADVVQQAVKDHAAPGLSEAELAGLAAAACSGRRAADFPPYSPRRTRA
jgi:Xaa-Pro aminopeptidase